MIKKRLSLSGRLVFFIPAIIVYFFSTTPTYTFSDVDESSLVIGLKHITDKAHICTEEEVRQFLENELKTKLPHLRKRASACGSRERVPLKLMVLLDGRELVNREYQPSGLYNDGNTFVYEKFRIRSGEHNIKVEMRDSKKDKKDRYDYSFTKSINFTPKRVVVLDFDPMKKVFMVN
ncbi:MAG: hypothetical protein ACE5EN_09710 [Nitrospinota bacterium]